MIGTLPMSTLAPLDYRYALDAAMATLAAHEPAAAVRPAVLVICRADALRDEIEQRLPQAGAPGAGGLWVEPDAHSWREDLATFARELAPGAALVVVASQPLARLMPERRGWRGAPLGLRAGGIGRLIAALGPAGFALRKRHGVHSLAAIGLLALSRQAQRRGRPELADRLHFAARLRYRAVGRTATLATVAMLIARRSDATVEAGRRA